MPANFAIVPAVVRYDKRLSPNAILLYMEIVAAMDATGITVQPAKYYMEIFGVTGDLVKKWLKELKDCGHVFNAYPDKPGLTLIAPEKFVPVVEPPKPKLTESEEEKLVTKWVVDEYHRICTSFPKVRALTDARKKSIRARFAEIGKKNETFTELFTKAQASKFLRGEKSGVKWKASFDFLMSPAGFVKTLEGKYADDQNNTRAPDDEGGDNL